MTDGCTNRHDLMPTRDQSRQRSAVARACIWNSVTCTAHQDDNEVRRWRHLGVTLERIRESRIASGTPACMCRCGMYASAILVGSGLRNTSKHVDGEFRRLLRFGGTLVRIWGAGAVSVASRVAAYSGMREVRNVRLHSTDPPTSGPKAARPSKRPSVAVAGRPTDRPRDRSTRLLPKPSDCPST